MTVAVVTVAVCICLVTVAVCMYLVTVAIRICLVVIVAVVTVAVCSCYVVTVAVHICSVLTVAVNIYPVVTLAVNMMALTAYSCLTPHTDFLARSLVVTEARDSVLSCWNPLHHHMVGGSVEGLHPVILALASVVRLVEEYCLDVLE